MTSYLSVPLFSITWRYVPPPLNRIFQLIYLYFKTLQKYTREYLFEKFKTDFKLQQQHHRLPHHVPQGLTSRTLLPSLSHSRPILAIETSPHPAANRHPSLSLSRGLSIGSEIRTNPIVRAAPDATSNMSSKISSSGPSQ